MRRGQYQDNRGNNGYPTLQNHPNRPPSPKFMFPSFPRGCPYCGLKFMNFYKLGGHLTAHRREMQESNRKVMGILAGRNLALGPPLAYAGAGPSNGGPYVELGVLEPRVENGNPFPRTLDLLGLGKAHEDKMGDDSEKIIIDLDPEGVEDHGADSPSCARKNKKVKV